MTDRQITAVIDAWHRDRRTLFGPERRARQEALYAALAAVGGEFNTGTLVALCDDVKPYVVIFDLIRSGRRNDTLEIWTLGNHHRVESLRRLNAERFGAEGRKRA